MHTPTHTSLPVCVPGNLQPHVQLQLPGSHFTITPMASQHRQNSICSFCFFLPFPHLYCLCLSVYLSVWAQAGIALCRKLKSVEIYCKLMLSNLTRGGFFCFMFASFFAAGWRPHDMCCSSLLHRVFQLEPDCLTLKNGLPQISLSSFILAYLHVFSVLITAHHTPLSSYMTTEMNPHSWRV